MSEIKIGYASVSTLVDSHGVQYKGGALGPHRGPLVPSPVGIPMRAV
jgi:hypothetical protein